MPDLIGPGEYKVIMGLKRFSLPNRDYRYRGKYFSILPCPNREVYKGWDENSQEPIFEEPTQINRHYPTCEFYITIPFQINKALEPNEVFKIGENKAAYLTTLIWLFKEGTVFSYIHNIVGPGITRNPRYWSWVMLDERRNPEPPIGRGEYVLDNSNDVRKLSSFINKYFDLDWTALVTVIKRLVAYKDREWGADLVVDLFIVLESLFVTGHENVSYQVRLKTATFLRGTNELVRLGRTLEDVFNFIQKAYNTRSAIVHGDRQGNEWLHSDYISGGFRRHNVHELEEIVRSCTRVSLEWLRVGKSINPKHFDKVLFLS
jgi:hypothetical protein